MPTLSYCSLSLLKHLCQIYLIHYSSMMPQGIQKPQTGTESLAGLISKLKLGGNTFFLLRSLQADNVGIRLSEVTVNSDLTEEAYV